ncbi:MULTISPECIES: PilZ domain-containing protein [unclassified Bradyrhizobium]|uniref:PilZ domain-containing protein n=1 Tax=unclassified Bradyrhizobium TaxID=2631580 RepID=UPI002479E87A|nr:MULTISPECIES: PilZ domain-containing protein [unclassified Bradyrhizobium]WGS24060.1 PilZ domain-containing protein [Bradyrhizobium sp. ISRA463]
MTGQERRSSSRIRFEQPMPAQLMAIDGTWWRECTMDHVSENGARLTVGASMEGLNLVEFFLLLSSKGLAYRRCKLAWVNGDRIGVTFLRRGKTPAKPPRSETAV